MKRVLKIFGIFTVFASTAGTLYYFLVFRSSKPQVELYFDDGSMLAMPSKAEEAAPFVSIAKEILTTLPLSG